MLLFDTKGCVPILLKNKNPYIRLAIEDLRADFIAAGSLLALAALSESDGSPERFTAGELTVQRGSPSAAAKCLRGQAELLMMPYVRDSFAFLGV